jgi:hypothetical protein
MGFIAATLLSVYRYGGISIEPLAWYPDLERNAICVWFSGTCHHISLTFTKISLLLFYRRVFQNFRFRQLADGLLMAVILFGIGYLIFYLAQCRPTQYYWQRVNPGAKGNCSNPKIALLVFGVFVAVMDFLVLLLPLRISHALHVPFKRKFQIVVLFIIGLMACIGGILRTYYLHEVLFNASASGESVTFKFWIFTSLEAFIGLICATLPDVKALWMSREAPKKGPGNLMYTSKLESEFQTEQTTSPERLNERDAHEEELSTYPAEVETHSPPSSSGTQKANNSAV